MTITTRAPVRIDFGGAWTDVPYFADRHGGAVFNAAIAHYVRGRLDASDEGLEVRYGFDLPAGSGLGTSAALNVAWLGLVAGRVSEGLERERIAEQAYQLEGILGILGGRQDQWAAALGGFQRMHFSQEGVVAERIALKEEIIAALQARSILVYTGKPRLSGTIHESVWDAFHAGRKETVDALHSLKALALAQPERLAAGDLDGFAGLIAENWEQQKRLDDSVSNAQIEALFAAAQAAGALGGKACGAGGGGCLYFVAREGRTDAVQKALEALGARPLPFVFEDEGLTRTVE